MPQEIVVCTYRVRPEAEDEFVGLLGRHWPTLHELGFVTDEPPLVLRELAELPTYVEIFSWTEHGYERAHQQKWQFPHYQRVE